MRLVCVANEVPWPANTGGRVDIWRRLLGLKAGGHKVALLCWYDEGRAEPPSSATLEKLAEVCDEVRIVPIRRSMLALLQRLSVLWRMPSHAASRWISARSLENLAWAQRFAPDVVLLDGLYGGAVAQWFAKELRKPLIYRSHNIEHLYMKDQGLRERRALRRLGLEVNRIGLERFEVEIIRSARLVLDISLEDRDFWVGRGFSHVEHLPTCVAQDFSERLTSSRGVPEIDVLYFGNLNTPNNVEAVRWLVGSVLPLVGCPDIRIALAGSSPSEEVRSLVGRDPRVELIENPEDMADVIAQARVLVNPMRAGSGVNLKSVEMLFSNAVLVSTSVGLKGLPDFAKSCFSVCDEPKYFAQSIIAGLQGSRFDASLREQARIFFGIEPLRDALSRVLGDVQHSETQRDGQGRVNIVLFVHQAAEMYGSDKVLLLIVKGLIERGNFFPVVLLPESGPLEDALREAGAEVHLSEVVKVNRAMFCLKGLLRLPLLIRSAVKDIDQVVAGREVAVVHSNTIAVLAGAAWAWSRKVRHVWHVHEIILSPRIVSRAFPWLVDKLSDRVISNSTLTEKWLLAERPGLRERSVVIFNGLPRVSAPSEQAVAEFRARVGAHPGEFLVTLAGRMSRWKGQDLLIEAAAELERMGTPVPVRFALVGDPAPGQEWMKQKFIDQIAAAGLRDKFSLLSFVNDIWPVWFGSDIAVVPSTEPEPFGMVAIEAMAAGVPVVAAAHGGLLDIVEHEKSGLLFKPRDPHELALAIRRLLVDESLRRNLGESGRRRQAQLFSVDSQVSRTERIYEEVVEHVCTA